VCEAKRLKVIRPIERDYSWVTPLLASVTRLGYEASFNFRTT
jgi:hypothetical protein